MNETKDIQVESATNVSTHENSVSNISKEIKNNIQEDLSKMIY